MDSDPESVVQPVGDSEGDNDVEMLIVLHALLVTVRDDDGDKLTDAVAEGELDHVRLVDDDGDVMADMGRKLLMDPDSVPLAESEPQGETVIETVCVLLKEGDTLLLSVDDNDTLGVFVVLVQMEIDVDCVALPSVLSDEVPLHDKVTVDEREGSETLARLLIVTERVSETVAQPVDETDTLEDMDTEGEIVILCITEELARKLLDIVDVPETVLLDVFDIVYVCVAVFVTEPVLTAETVPKGDDEPVRVADLDREPLDVTERDLDPDADCETLCVALGEVVTEGECEGEGV